MYGLKLQKCVGMNKFEDLINVIEKFKDLILNDKNFGYFMSYDLDKNTATVKVQYNTEDIDEMIGLAEYLYKNNYDVEFVGCDFRSLVM